MRGAYGWCPSTRYYRILTSHPTNVYAMSVLASMRVRERKTYHRFASSSDSFLPCLCNVRLHAMLKQPNRRISNVQLFNAWTHCLFECAYAYFECYYRAKKWGWRDAPFRFFFSLFLLFTSVGCRSRLLRLPNSSMVAILMVSLCK